MTELERLDRLDNRARAAQEKIDEGRPVSDCNIELLAMEAIEYVKWRRAYNEGRADVLIDMAYVGRGASK